MRIGNKLIEYRIEHRTSGGTWEDEGYCFETLEEAKEELAFLKGYGEKYRIVETHGTIIWEANAE
jgi:hypothetical protein